MRAGVTIFAVSAMLAASTAFAGIASAQQNATSQALQRAIERTCVVEITSVEPDRIELQNICFNPRAVRINWGDGRLVDYCLNSAGDVRYVRKLADSYTLTREQDILLCH